MCVFPWAHTAVSTMFATEIAQSLLAWTRVTVGETAWNGAPRWEESGICRFLFLLLRKNKQKSSTPATHKRKKLPRFAVYRCSPTKLGVSSRRKPEGGDGSTIADGKSFCVSVGRGTLECACHLVSTVQGFLVFYWPSHLTIKWLFSHRCTSLVSPRVEDPQLSFMFCTEKGRLSAWRSFITLSS